MDQNIQICHTKSLTLQWLQKCKNRSEIIPVFLFLFQHVIFLHFFQDAIIGTAKNKEKKYSQSFKNKRELKGADLHA